MKRFALYLLLPLVGAGIGAGVIWLVQREEETDGPQTTALEVGTLEDLAAEVEARTDEVLRMARFCERNQDRYADTRAEGYDACFEQEAEPINDSADQLVEETIDELKREVGPNCLRALRRAEISLGGSTLELPEDLVKRAARSCKQEASP